MILRCFAASDARFASYSVQGCKHTVYAAPQKAVLSRASRRLTRSPLYVAAFKESPDNAITFPLDYYRVLTVNRASSPEVVRVAYERQLRSPPDVGYTQDTLFSRAVLLRDAAECLQNYNSRRMYDSMALSSTGYAVDVSPHYLPAALVLLQESGQSGLVIKLGAEWLSRNSGDQTACDVAAAVALAHCDEAAEALVQDTSTVLRACQHLEVALQLLRQHKVAPQLQQQIMQTLEDYSPNYCLELLALPLDDGHKKQRQRGMTLLRKLAFDLPQDLSPITQKDRDSFLSSARTRLTQQELLDFYKALPAGARVGCQQKMDVALASIALGYQLQQPHMVQQAASMYQQLRNAAAKEGQLLDLSVERAACALMLGDMQQAQQLLGLASDTSSSPVAHADDSIAAFVLQHSPDEGDLLPGIYVLGETWLQEEVLGGFRQDRQDMQPEQHVSASLSSWFDCKTVQRYIQAYALLRTISILTAFHMLRDAITACFSWAVTVMQRVFGRGTTADGIASTRQAVQPQAQQPTEVQPEQHMERKVQNRLAQSESSADAMLDDSTGSEQLQEQELNVSQLRQRWHRKEDNSQQSKDNKGAPPEQQMQLRALEAAMWDSAEAEGDATAIWRKKAMAMLLLAAAAVATAWLIRPSNTRASSAVPVKHVWSLSSQL